MTRFLLGKAHKPQRLAQVLDNALTGLLELWPVCQDGRCALAEGQEALGAQIASLAPVGRLLSQRP